jgi:hypothetical protein
MPLRIDLFPPDRAAIRQIVMEGQEVVLGRDIDAGIRLDHASVSRTHARLRCVDQTWLLQDLKSKNGSFVDGNRVVDEEALPDNAQLRFGDVHADAVVIDNDQVADFKLNAARRRKTVAEHSIGLHQVASGQLLQRTLDSMVELVEADRGFVLVNTSEGLRVAAHRGVPTEDDGGALFCGSLTQVNRAILLKTPLVTNAVAHLPAGTRSQSLSGGAIASLLAWPLVHAGEVLAAIYVDHITQPRTIDELDLELLAAFTEQATLCLAADRRRQALEGWSARAATAGGLAPSRA